ncbi:MAG: O-antigen ligase family protein [Candidatus Ornithomonoglobus sp.]
MNSIIITTVVSSCLRFADYFTKSRLWAIIMGINRFFQRSWKNSRIMSFLKTGGISSRDSFFGRVIMSPFTLTEIIRDKTGEKLAEKVDKSVICETARAYVQNFMAVNTRFWGIMLLCATLVFNALHFLRGMGVNKIVLCLSVIAALLSLVNLNVMGWLSGSKVIEFCKACAGVKYVTFDFYDEKKTKGITRLIAAILMGVLTGGIMAVMPLYGMLIPFAAFGMLLVLQYPVTGVYAAVFVAPLIPFSSMPIAGICLWTTVSLVIKSILDKKFVWKRDGVGIALLIFLAVLLVSCIFSFSRASSLMVWVMYFIFVTFYFAIINTIRTRAQLYGLLRLFVISGALVALYGVMQYAFGWTTTNAWIDEEMFEDETMRVYSTLANPNVLGEYLLLVLPVSALFFLKDKAKSLSKWVYLAVTGLIFLCLILTQSRGCWLGFMVTVVLFIPFYEGRWWAFIPLVLCILPFIVPQTIVDRLMSIGNLEDSSTSYRVYIWMGAIGMLRHYLAGGIGMGESAFNQVYPFFSYNAIIAPHSHNTFLQLLVEGGIPALVSFLAVIVVYLKGAQRIYSRRAKKSFNSSMTLALAAGVCGFLFQSLFDYTFYNYRVMAVFFMVIGITMCFRYITSKEEGDI